MMLHPVLTVIRGGWLDRGRCLRLDLDFAPCLFATMLALCLCVAWVVIGVCAVFVCAVFVCAFIVINV